jgi:hypothetical protein
MCVVLCATVWIFSYFLNWRIHVNLKAGVATLTFKRMCTVFELTGHVGLLIVRYMQYPMNAFPKAVDILP